MTRKLICRLMEALLAAGWHCLTSIDLSRRASDKSVLLFYRCQPARTRYASIALSDTCKMRFINFPTEMVEILKQTARDSYLPGITKEKQRINNCYQMNLLGLPWVWPSCDALHARSMMLQLLKEAQRNNWHLVASADVSASFIKPKNQPAYPVDVHSWFFCQVEYVNMTATTPEMFPSAPPSGYVVNASASLEIGTDHDLPPTYDEALAFP